MIHTKKAKSIIPKLCGILFLLVLFVTLTNPIWRARDNKVDEYRDYYRYQLTARNYYRVVRSSSTNLTVLASEMEVKGAFTVLNLRYDLLDTDDELSERIYELYGTLRTIPDPGDRSMVSAVFDCQEAYENYRNLILSGNYHGDDYLELLHEARDELRRAERDLLDEVYDE